MTATAPTSARPARRVHLAVWVVLASFVAYLFVGTLNRWAGYALMVAATVFLAVCVAAWWRTAPPSRGYGVVAVGCAVGIIASCVYLGSLPDDGADIPLVGVGVLFLSLCGLPVAGLLTRDRQRDS